MTHAMRKISFSDQQIAGLLKSFVQASRFAGLGDGSFNTNFVDISLPFIGPRTGVLTTNYLDTDVIEDSPSRYYRIRLVP